MEPLTLTPEQEEDVNTLVSHNTGGAILASEMGQGKTVVAVETLIRKGFRRVLIPCPLATRIGWERTLVRQGWGHGVYRIDSTKAGKEAQARFMAGEPGAYLVGHAMFRSKVAMWEAASMRKRLALDAVVYDEVQDVCNRQSQGFKILKKVKAPYKMAVSGTYFGNKFENSWAPARWLWWDYVGEGTEATGNRHVDTAFDRWRAAWCTTSVNQHKKDASEFSDGLDVTGELVPGAWANYLPVYIRREAKYDHKVTTEDLFVELTPKQRKAYDELEKDALTWLEDNPLMADLPIVKRIRMRQATLAEPSIRTVEVMKTVEEYDETTDQMVKVRALVEQDEVYFELDAKSPKLDALKEFLGNLPGNENVLIYTDSKRYAKVLHHRLGTDSALWDGDTPQAEREQMITDFGHKFKYLIATIAAMGPGVDGLQAKCNTVVWMSQSEDGALNDQALARLNRTGQTRDVRSVHIKAAHTLDENIFGRLLSQELANRASMRRYEE